MAALKSCLALVLWAAVMPLSIAKVDLLDLGSHPATGKDAIFSQPDRNRRIATAQACQDEVNFLDAFATGRAIGDHWPTSHLIAKAAFAGGRYDLLLIRDKLGLCEADEAFPDLKLWESVFVREEPTRLDGVPMPFDGAAAWKPVNAETDPKAKASALATAIGQLYRARFGDVCEEVVTYDRAVGLHFSLSANCLMRQIMVVVTHPHLGAWKIEDGQYIPQMPGTSASKMPCVTAFPDKPLENVGGDWDMGVLDYSRLAYLIYTSKAARPALLTTDADLALDKLNRWLLTLRGGPARELYDLVLSCGNPANSFGSADDYVNDNDVYNKDTNQTVSGENDSEPSFWEKLWRILRILAIAAAVAFTVGAALGALAGSGILAGGAAAAVTVVTVVVVVGVWTIVNIGGIEETENHLFMQNSSKYLKNKLMLAELRQSGNRDGFDKVSSENEDVRKWLLKRMHRVVDDDFVEYNAKPYGRLSHMAILNLLDYACEVSWSWDSAVWPPKAGDRQCDPKDMSVVNGAASVYDLSAAKAALGSNEGRRLIPFRRLVETNFQYHEAWTDNGTTQPPRNFHDMFGNADHLIAALQAWTGSTQHGPNGLATAQSITEMMWYATSRYLPHEMILDLAVDKSSPIEQSYKHGGREAYSSGPRWLLTAGGDSTHSAQGLRVNILPFGVFGADFNLYAFSPDNDKGAGVPTTLMVTGIRERRDTMQSFLRFEGKIEDFGDDDGKPLKSFSNNRCLSGNFACGLRLEIPEAIRSCLKTPTNNPDAPAGLKFISSAACPEYARAGAGNDFFVAVYERVCDNCDYPNWGFVEVAEAGSFQGSLQLYQDLLIAANKPNFSGWRDSKGKDKLTFYSVQRKQSYRFEPYDEDFDRSCRACGSVVEGDDAKFQIRNPRWPGKSIAIDYSDDMNPRRSGQGGLSLGAL